MDCDEHGSIHFPGGTRAGFWAGLWRLADPKISLASMASLFLGTCAAVAAGPLHGGWLFVTVLGIFAIEVAKNASGEIVDFDSGTDLAVADRDRSPFSGGKRVLVDGLLTRRQAAAIAAAGYGLAWVAGLWIVFHREPAVLGLGVAGVLLAWWYHAAPLRLAYRGLGELAVALCYGPGICVGAYLVQRHEAPPDVWAVSVPLGLLVAAFLWINEFPDCEADRAAGKRTLVVRLGKRRAARGFVALQVAAFAGLGLAPLAGVSMGAWLGAIALFPSVGAARRILRDPADTARLIPAQARALLALILYALGAGLGLVFVPSR